MVARALVVLFLHLEMTSSNWDEDDPREGEFAGESAWASGSDKLLRATEKALNVTDEPPRTLASARTSASTFRPL